MLLKIKNTFNRLSKRIDVNSLDRLRPISNCFGLDRGTPIDRYYIDAFLCSHFPQSVSGVGLEVNETKYLEKFGTSGFKKIPLIYSEVSRLTDQALFCDLSKPETVPQGIFDIFICTQTVNFIYDIDAFFNSCRKLLKQDGLLLCTASGVTQISRFDMDRWGDYWRFTSLGLKRKLENHFGEDFVSVRSYGNLVSCISLLQGLSVEDLPKKEVLDFHDPNYELLIGGVAIKKS